MSVDKLKLAVEAQFTDAQIVHMVAQFLAWKLPADFRPDAGISFKAEYNEHTNHPMRHEPSGTNLLNYTQARTMVEHMLDGLPGYCLEGPLTADEQSMINEAWEKHKAAAPQALVAIRAPEAPGEVEALLATLDERTWSEECVTDTLYRWDQSRHEAAALIRQQQAEIARLREALTGVDDDYMTSDTHHPGYVLIPAEKFERLRTATQHEGAKRLKKPLVGNWFYPAEEGERCYFSPYEVIEEYYDPEPGKHVFEITVAAPLPSIWCAVVAADDPDADERYTITEHASEEEARAALSQEPGQ